MELKAYLKEFRKKEKSLKFPKRLPTDLEMQHFELGRAGMAADIFQMLKDDQTIDLGYLRDVIYEWNPELWQD